jgi:tRNA nucleotidyltransferase (CCA-adding enzyme)
MRRPALAEVLRALPEPAAPLVEALLAAADARRLRVYLVGGPVRDLLLARPLHDVDLIVEPEGGIAAPELADLARVGDAETTRHPRFGTVTLRSGAASVDVATARRERYAHDGALPIVEAGSLEEDLLRRDFSVNALALPLSKAARAGHAGIVDFDEGSADLEARRLRVLHPRSFHDDPTRALRAARLAPRLGFALSRGSRAALRDALRDGSFGRVSGDRLRREWVKLFDDARLGLDPARALRLLAEWHVLGALEPGLGLARPCLAPLRRLGRATAQPPWSRGIWRPWVSGLALWLAPLPAALRRRALQRFAVRGRASEAIAAFPRARDGWLRALERARGRGRVDGVLSELDEEALHALYASASPPVRRRMLRWVSEDRGRRAPLGGEDLVALGLAGPSIGRVLAQVRAAFLDARVKTRAEALALAEEIARGARG